MYRFFWNSDKKLNRKLEITKSNQPLATALVPDVGDVRNAAECDKESIKACVKEKENEVLVVSKPNTVPNPWTVVIHLQHALKILQFYIVHYTIFFVMA